MIELDSKGNRLYAQCAKGHYVAGPNSLSWAGISVNEFTPDEWTGRRSIRWMCIAGCRSSELLGQEQSDRK